MSLCGFLLIRKGWCGHGSPGPPLYIYVVMSCIGIRSVRILFCYLIHFWSTISRGTRPIVRRCHDFHYADNIYRCTSELRLYGSMCADMVSISPLLVRQLLILHVKYVKCVSPFLCFIKLMKV